MIACVQRPPFPAGAEAPVVSFGISTPFGELFRVPGQITHVLRTRAPLYSSLRTFSLDLHVLGTPPAFVLSQDQTLQLRDFDPCPLSRREARNPAPLRGTWHGVLRMCLQTQRNAGPHSSYACYSVFKDRAPPPSRAFRSSPSPDHRGVAKTTVLRQGGSGLRPLPGFVKKVSPARHRRPSRLRGGDCYLIAPNSSRVTGPQCVPALPPRVGASCTPTRSTRQEAFLRACGHFRAGLPGAASATGGCF
jgi:hypothetical protein